uniref:Zinc-ribbon domain-containing protein n=1 Tax=Equus asinus TaxID=9793 RepID=A0A8C4M8H3_EQUAS
MITICPDCGKSIEAGFKFCLSCEKPLPTEEHEGSPTFVRALVSSFREESEVVHAVTSLSPSLLSVTVLGLRIR